MRRPDSRLGIPSRPTSHKLFLLAVAMFAAGWSAAEPSAKSTPASRIVSLSPAVTEQIFILGVHDRLVGCTSFCNRPTAAQEKQKVGTIIAVNLEQVVALNPDLVIGSSLTKPGTIAKLRELGMEVAIFNAPHDFKTFFSQFIDLGKLVGEQEKATRMARESLAELAKTKAASATADPPPKVLLQIGSSPLYLAGNDSFVSDFIAYSGGTNILGERLSGVYSKEMIVAENPDVIIIVTMGFAAEHEKNDWMRFNSLKAVSNARIFIYDSSRICSPSPTELPATVAEIAGLLHPDNQQKINGILPTIP